MPKIEVYGVSDDDVTISLKSGAVVITPNPTDKKYVQDIPESEQSDYTPGELIDVVSGIETKQVAFVAAPEPITITPGDGTVLTSAEQSFVISPWDPTWTARLWMGDNADEPNNVWWRSDGFKATNQFRMTGLPTNGEVMTLQLAVNRNDAIEYYTYTITAHTVVAPYRIFDAQVATSTFEIRPYGANIDDDSTAPVAQVQSGTRYRIRAAFVDSLGDYSGNRPSTHPVVPMTSNAGTPTFVKREAGTIYNLYDFTPNGSGTVTFTFGVHVDAARSASITATISLPFAATGAYKVPPILPLRVSQVIWGFGTDTAAGRGGQVIRVTSNATTGPGTFAEACATPGPRQIVFNVHGEITLPQRLTIAAGQVSVYAHTAPGDGLYFRGGLNSLGSALTIKSSDVYLYNMRLLRGGLNGNGGSSDSVSIGDPNNPGTISNVVLDHCTVAWGVDECIDTLKLRNATFYRCLFAEGLYDNSHNNSTPGQGYLATIGPDTDRISIIQCIFTCYDYRGPGIFGARNVDLFNCLIAGYGRHAVVVQPQRGFTVTGNIERNLFIDAQTERTSLAELYALANPGGTNHPPAFIRMHVNGNGRQTGPIGSAIQPIRVGGDGGPVADTTADVRWNQSQVATPRPAAIDLANLESVLVANCGAGSDQMTARVFRELSERNMPWKDIVGGEVTTDYRGINNAASQGTVKDVPWPVLAGGPSKLGSADSAFVKQSWRLENNQTGNPATTDSNGDGRTDFEDYMEWLKINSNSAPVGNTLENLGAKSLLPDARGYGMTAAEPSPFNDVRHIDNLGQLQAALGPARVLYLNFPGWHTVASQLEAGHPGLRICGQTAPGDGVGFTCGANNTNLLSVGSGTNVVLEHFSLAPTLSGPDGDIDAMRVENNPASNVLFRNMAFHSGRDQTLSVWFGGTQNIVFDKCIIGPTTYNYSGRGAVIGGGSTRVLFYRSLFAGCNGRNPMFQGHNMSIVCCIISGWAAEATTWQDKGGGASGNGINLRFISGPDSNPSERGEVLFYDDGGNAINVYLSGCTGTRQPNPNGDQRALVATVVTNQNYVGNPTGVTLATSPVGDDLELGPLNELIPSLQLESELFPIIGPTPNRRNAHIRDTIQRSANGTMKPNQTYLVSDLPLLAGGLPRIDTSRADKTSAQWRSEFQIPDNTNCLTTDGPDGQRLAEHFLNWLGNAA